MAISLMMLMGCATQLTEAGRKIRVAGNTDNVQQCARVSRITGEAGSFLNNGEYGIIYATIDARNKAAQIHGVDTIDITSNEPRFFSGTVSAIAYDCSKLTRNENNGNNAHNTLEGKQPAESIRQTTVFEKAKKCQDKGGVWVNDKCVISIK
ncbi:MAG: hypothetical protein ABSA86_01045 [Oryzomonas sp.]|jgi:hypothetical protein